MSNSTFAEEVRIVKRLALLILVASLLVLTAGPLASAMPLRGNSTGLCADGLLR